MEYSLKKGCALVLRTCASDMSSHGGFVWPKSGVVEAPDWKDTTECGNGLHGWLWGQGDFRLRNDDPNRVWLVVETESESIISLGNKVKFQKGEVVFCGFWWDAMAFVRRHRPKDKKLEAFNSGDSGHAAATGSYGHAAATGDSGHAAATGSSGHAAATGDSGHAAATGSSGHAAATGSYGHAAATGSSGHAAATGSYGHAAATGDSGHAAATGSYGHAAATGSSGHAAATGKSSIACALGSGGVVKSGENGALIATYWSEAQKRWRVVVGYVGEEGIKAGQEYTVKNGKLVRANN